MSEESGRASTPDDTTIEGVIASIRSSQALAAEEPLDGNTCLLDRGLALDSVALLDLALALEVHFDLRIEDHDLTTENFETVSAVVKLIDGKREHLGPNDA